MLVGIASAYVDEKMQLLYVIIRTLLSVEGTNWVWN